MKVLYITSEAGLDYQDDCLLIGLKELLGSDVVDVNKRSHIYTSYDPVKTSGLYGRGFTVTRILEDLEIDRENISDKIKEKYFDIVVYGSIWRNSDHLEEVLKFYTVDKIAAIDGEDHVGIHPIYNKGVQYFKRELSDDMGCINPISFAISECKINLNTEKIVDLAFCDPNDRKTYIYTNELDYYHGYGESRLAHTKKKAGWDCMRHYEIIANGCIPLFEDIQNCPSLTMVGFPKDVCLNVYNDFSKDRNVADIYDEYSKFFIDNIHAFTTKLLAKYFIDKMINR